MRALPAATTQKPGIHNNYLPLRLLCNFACQFGYCKQDNVCNPALAPPPPPPYKHGWFICWGLEQYPMEDATTLRVFLHSYPDCNDWVGAPMYYTPLFGDVSGAPGSGVACDGGCNGNPGEEVDRLVFNPLFGPYSSSHRSGAFRWYANPPPAL